ncbi:MAG: hypothetical protein LBQ18_07005, partial [Campylobacteraceae bacterium]|nr:hypothetical protein [Campylobacteraceae bacterium]
MAETEIDNEEIVYKVTQRSLLYLWCGDILPAGLLLFLSTEIFMSYSPISITLICVGVALFIVGAYFLLESLAFNELIIYKDRVLIDKYILGKHIINIDDIKR